MYLSLFVTTIYSRVYSLHFLSQASHVYVYTCILFAQSLSRKSVLINCCNVCCGESDVIPSRPRSSTPHKRRCAVALLRLIPPLRQRFATRIS